MADTISILSEIRSSYNCFDEEEEPYYRALTKGIEAIKVAQQEIDYWRDKCKMYEQAVEMAYAELPDICVGDIISRQAAIDVVSDCGICIQRIVDLPSAERKGHWIYGEDEYGIDGYRCDKCGFFVQWDYVHKFINFIEDYHYCPSCGARMESE